VKTNEQSHLSTTHSPCCLRIDNEQGHLNTAYYQTCDVCASIMCHASHYCSFLQARLHIDNEQSCLRPAYYQCGLSGDHTQCSSKTDHKQNKQVPCELTPEVLSPPPRPCTRTAGFARILRMLPRLPLSPFPASVDQHAEVLPHPPLVLAASHG